MDEDGNETFDAGVALDKLRKVSTYSLTFDVRSITSFFGYCRIDGIP